MQKLSAFKQQLIANKFWKNLFKNSFWALLGDSSAALVSLIVSIVIIKLIGTSQYGEFMLAQTYMNVIDTILNVQSWQGVIYFGQCAVTKHRANDLHGIIKLGIIIDFLTAILGGIIALVFATYIGQLFRWSTNTIACAIIFSYTVFSHIAGTPTGILRLFDKFNLVALQKFLSAAIKLFCLFVLIVGGNTNLVAAATVYVIGDCVGNLLLVVFALFVYCKNYQFRQILHAKLPQKTVDFIKYTLWSTLNGIVDLPVSYLDIFIVSLLGTTKVAIYKVFKQIVSILSRATSPIQQASLPQFTDLVAQHKANYGFQVVLKISHAIIKIFGPFILFAGLSSPLWLNLLYGPEYSAYWWILALFLIAQLFALSFTTIHPFFFALGKARESTLFIAIANLLYFIIAITSIQAIGLIAMVIAYAVQISCAIGLKYFVIRRKLGHVTSKN